MERRYIANYDVDPCQCQKLYRSDLEGEYRGMEECVYSTGCQAQKKWKRVFDTDKETCKCVESPDGTYTSPKSCTIYTGCPEYIPNVPGPWYVLQSCTDWWDGGTCNNMQYKCKGHETLPSDFLEEVGGIASKSLKQCLVGFGAGHHVYLDKQQNEECGICSEEDCRNAREHHLLDDFEDPNYEDTWPNWFACRAGGGGYSRAKSMNPNYFKGNDYYGKPLCKKGCCNIMSCVERSDSPWYERES